MPSLRSSLSGDSDVQVRVSTTADNKGLEDTQKGLKDTGDRADDTGKRFSEFGRIAAVAVAAVATAAVGFAVSSVKAFQESEEVAAQTTAVLKSTAGVAGMTSEAVTALAGSLQRVTRFSDETVQSGENMLLTFTNIGQNIFPDATKVMLDMSQALGQDVKNSAIQLGKALNDPIAGVTALKKVGVTFTQQQQDQIKTLVNSNKTLDAQKVILQELQKEFGGSAEAAGNTFGGQIDRLNNQLGQAQETIGEYIVKAITPVTKKTLDWIDSMGGVEGIAKNVINWIGSLSQGFMEMYTPIADYLGPKLNELWKSIDENLIPVLKDLWQNVLAPLIPVIGQITVVAVGLLIDALSTLFGWIGWVSDEFKAGNPVVIGLATAFTALASAMALNDAFNTIKMGMDLLKLNIIPGVIAKVAELKVLMSTPTLMGGVVIAGALADIGLVMQAVISVQNAISAMNAAASTQSALQKTNADLKASAMKYYAAGDKAKGDALMKNANSNNNVDTPSWFDQAVTGTLGKFATGTRRAPAGIALVGENGPELVNLPQGSQVHNTNDSSRMMGGGTNQIHIENFNVNSAEAMDRFLEVQDSDQWMVSNGLSPNRGTA